MSLRNAPQGASGCAFACSRLSHTDMVVAVGQRHLIYVQSFPGRMLAVQPEDPLPQTSVSNSGESRGSILQRQQLWGGVRAKWGMIAPFVFSPQQCGIGSLSTSTYAYTYTRVFSDMLLRICVALWVARKVSLDSWCLLSSLLFPQDCPSTGQRLCLIGLTMCLTTCLWVVWWRRLYCASTGELVPMSTPWTRSAAFGSQ